VRRRLDDVRVNKTSFCDFLRRERVVNEFGKMRASVVFWVVVACAVAASAWAPYKLDDPADAWYFRTQGEHGKGLRFYSLRTTSSPYTLPTPEVVVASRTCTSSACPEDAGPVGVLCSNVCFRPNVVSASDTCSPPRWLCQTDLEEGRKSMFEVADSVVICEDGEGRPSVNVGQPYLPRSCFVKVSLVDHTMPDPVKRENPMLHTTLDEDRARVEL
jgi:hypothetical protein